MWPHQRYDRGRVRIAKGHQLWLPTLNAVLPLLGVAFLWVAVAARDLLVCRKLRLEV
jgi:hypothetical protein